MNTIKSYYERYSWAIFSGLTILISFAITLLPLPSEGLPFLIVLVPAVVAIVMTGISAGRAGVAALLRQLNPRRASLKWYAVALILALALRLGVGMLGVLVGWIPALQFRTWDLPQFIILALILLIAAVPEELGWRGYALPRLIARWSALASSLVIGVLWGALHLSLTLPGMIYAGEPWLGTVLQLVGLSVLITWLYVHARGSLAIASLFHAAQSFFVIVHEGLSVGQQLWLMAAVYLGAALIVTLWSGSELRRRSREHAPALNEL